MATDAQSGRPFLKDGFKLITRDLIENPHDTIQKLLFLLEYRPHQRGFELTEAIKVWQSQMR
jgi:hypothetical protein